MIQFDTDHNQKVRQQFLVDTQSLKNQITALQTFNHQLSDKLQSLIERKRTIQAKRVAALNPPTYSSFCDTYAPKLWGLIMAAQVAAPQAEAMLINTLTKAWQQFDHATLNDKYVLSRLLTLAAQEGLPLEGLKAIFRPPA